MAIRTDVSLPRWTPLIEEVQTKPKGKPVNMMDLNIELCECNKAHYWRKRGEGMWRGPFGSPADALADHKTETKPKRVRSK